MPDANLSRKKRSVKILSVQIYNNFEFSILIFQFIVIFAVPKRKLRASAMKTTARVVELVDTQVSGTCGWKAVQVRVLSRAQVTIRFDPVPHKERGYFFARLLLYGKKELDL